MFKRFLFLLITFLSFVSPCFSVTYGEFADQFSKNPKPDFSDILLVVNYNHPFYDSIPLIRELYGEDFPHIVFYGEKKHPEVIQIIHKTGFWAQNVFQDAMERFPQFNGYLCIQDDVFINFWNFSRFDKNAIWYSTSFSNIVIDADHSGWPFWDTPDAKTAIIEVYATLKRKYSNFYTRMVATNGVNCCPMRWADCFYIPKRFKKSYSKLAKVFMDPPVFIELAIPSILTCLDSVENWEELTILNSHTSPREAGAMADYLPSYDWIHPFKYSNPKVQAYARSIIASWREWKSSQ